MSIKAHTTYPRFSCLMHVQGLNQVSKACVLSTWFVMIVGNYGRLQSGRRKHITCEQFSGKLMRFLMSIFALSSCCPCQALPRKCSCHLESWLSGLFTPFHEIGYQKFVVKNCVSSGVNEEWVQMISCVVGCAGSRLWILVGACAPSQKLVLVE